MALSKAKEVEENLTPAQEHLRDILQTNRRVVLFAYSSKAEHDRDAYRLMMQSRHHLAPGSVYIGAIGKQWKPGAWERVVKMMRHTRQQGCRCNLEEIRDPMTGFPYTSIGGMRDRAILHARDGGYEYVCIMDNDALPEPDLLIRLMEHDVAAVAPAIYRSDGQLLANPTWPLGSGLKVVRWAPYTMVLFKTALFNCFPSATPFAALDIEDVFYAQLRHYGHHMYLDMNARLDIAEEPHYTGEIQTWEDYMAFLKNAYEARHRVPDRAPLIEDEPGTTHYNGHSMYGLDIV